TPTSDFYTLSLHDALPILLPAGVFNISTGTTLRGNGVINCPVTLPSGATLAPGDSVGTLTVNSSVALQAGSTTRIEINKATGTRSEEHTSELQSPYDLVCR